MQDTPEIHPSRLTQTQNVHKVLPSWLTIIPKRCINFLHSDLYKLKTSSNALCRGLRKIKIPLHSIGRDYQQTNNKKNKNVSRVVTNSEILPNLSVATDNDSKHLRFPLSRLAKSRKFQNACCATCKHILKSSLLVCRDLQSFSMFSEFLWRDFQIIRAVNELLHLDLQK